ncbi:MAG: Gfo/Idh/MocA family oxidoreductase [Anaerolineales bacterium]|nr:Gfo/Idh/MocA family oxidoreductase [Anaerolineales bacterium]
MKFLIAGLGSIGRRHLRNLVALGEQDIVLYRSYRSTLPDDDVAVYPVETNLEAALSYKPDAVIVATPTSLHLEVAIPAVRAGSHLLLEKPISHSLEGVDELRKAARENQSQILVGYQFRFHPSLIQARKWIQEGAIGQPLSFRAVYGEYLPGMHPWEDYRVSYSARRDLGGGVIFTLCHPLDIVRWMLGEVSELWAFSGCLNSFGLEVEDTAEIGIRFDNGALGSVHLNYNQRPADHHLEVIGNRGTLRWNNMDGKAAIYRANDVSKGVSDDKWEIYQPPPGFQRNDMFLEELRHFLAVARGEVAPQCTLDDGRKALEIALAAHSSAQNGQLVQMTSFVGE